ncbi:hypothetical protein [Cereibacter azotoformans]|uniref:hypothetical protein n=1 Tax=Cereibacter azotoformans TaxID=43057 RepID=UPI0011B24D08|nr:hypothetical protein [Cereibacter azotoformans]MBO4169540.1 hypothetical protein [Cereibacter azotoformans]
MFGIDPGTKGGLACAEMLPDCSGYAWSEAMPLPYWKLASRHDHRTETVGFRMPDVIEIARILREKRPDFIVLEHVGTDDQFGAKSAWTFGAGFGALLAVCMTAMCDDDTRVKLVRPTTWQAALKRGKDKPLSIQQARDWFGIDCGDEDGPAEALVLIEYFRRFIVPTGEVECI